MALTGNGKELEQLWEILIPNGQYDHDRTDFSKHREWDEFILSKVPGMTILRSAKGYWAEMKNDCINGTMYCDRMIPVRLYTNYQTILDIAVFTKQHYQEKCVMFYKISDNVYFV